MCWKCGNDAHLATDRLLGRREVMKGLGLAAASATTMAMQPAAAQTAAVDVADRPIATRAFGVADARSPVRTMTIQRRAVGPGDVLIDILYSGICHSDVHQACDEWRQTAPTTYPCVPGHEIVGRVQAVGRDVTKFKVGDMAGVGCFVRSCGTCVHCLDDREQNCVNGATFTYNSPDAVSGGMTLGGFSEKVVVGERTPSAFHRREPRRNGATALRRHHHVLAAPPLARDTRSEGGCRRPGRAWPHGRQAGRDTRRGSDGLHDLTRQAR